MTQQPPRARGRGPLQDMKQIMLSYGQEKRCNTTNNFAGRQLLGPDLEETTKPGCGTFIPSALVHRYRF
ncbi:TPA: hypothetical protein ACH3X1_007541 [Trebouxia sp. C0004]